MNGKKITQGEVDRALRVFAARDLHSAAEVAGAVRVVEAADAQGGAR